MTKIFDFHTHPYMNLYSNLCPHKEVIPMQWQDIRPMYDKLGVSGIAGSVILRKPGITPWESIAQGNDMALELHRLLGDFYYPGCHVHPDHIPESLGEIRRFADLGFHLVGELVPYLHGWEDYSRKDFGYLLDACRDHGMVVNMHSMDDEAMDRMVAEHKDVTIVMAHPNEKESFLRHLKRMDVSQHYHLDLAGTGLFRHGMLARGIAEQGAERFLFGSDYPVCNPGMFVGGVTLDELIRPEDREKILYGNAKRLLGLKA